MTDEQQREAALAALAKYKDDLASDDQQTTEGEDAAFIAGHLSVLATRQQVDAWQPIETAPKDGTSILIWEPDSDCHYVAKWVRQPGNGIWHVDHAYIPKPTHWKPLDKPPTLTPKVAE